MMSCYMMFQLGFNENIYGHAIYQRRINAPDNADDDINRIVNTPSINMDVGIVRVKTIIFAAINERFSTARHETDGL